MRRTWATVVAAVTFATVGVVAAPPPALAADEVVAVPASGSWDVEGRGWGHGIGLSQWGAQGAALQGLTSEQILDFYYPGTQRYDIGQDFALRVRLSAFTGAISASLGPVPGDSLTVRDVSTGASVTLAAGTRLTVTRTASGLTLASTAGATSTPLVLGGTTVVGGPVEVGAGTGSVWAYKADGTGTRYPGAIRVHQSGAAVDVVAHVAMEQYLRGVVPRESPSGWQSAALAAQAVAARTYALSVRDDNAVAHLCDTTACQVYGGAATSTAAGVVTELYAASTDAAVLATARIARYYGGGPAFTQFSSSNGGYVKAGGKPYLVAKADPYTGTAPGDTRTRWTSTLSAARVQQSCPSGGTLQQMTLTRDGNGDLGGRVLTARLQCTTGTATVNTPAFGLLSSWWRPTAVGAVPFGGFDAVSSVPGPAGPVVNVSGWAADSDAPTQSIPVDVTIDGTLVGTVTAAGSRPDVGAALPGFGSSHGFSATYPATAGTRQVCIRAVNVPSGPPATLGCKQVTVPGAGMTGNFEHVSTSLAGITVTGWALDLGRTNPVAVRVEVVGGTSATATADVTRLDVGAVYPANGAGHGFVVTVPAPAGASSVCVTAVDTTKGTGLALGCRTVHVPDASPLGNIESATGGPGGITVRGWAFDPSSSDQIYVWANVDGVGGPILAGLPRPDVTAAYPAATGSHGFSALLSAPGGTHTVCLTAVNRGAGADRSLGCRTATVPGGSPFGNLESTTGVPGGIALTGWALDPDTDQFSYIWVTVDGRGQYVLAGQSRPDVARVYPAYSRWRGFSDVIPAAAGSHSLCVTVANVGLGSNTALGCRTVMVPVA